MQLIPDWAPNIHPIIVHFPIVLLAIAVLFDIIGLLFKKMDWLKKSSLLLFVLGTMAAIVAFLSGRYAAEGLNPAVNVIPTLTEHADWAEIAMWFFIIFSVIRLFITWKFNSIKNLVIVPIVFTGIVGIYFLYQTGDHGAKLVFGYGLGTGNIVQKNELADKEKEVIVSDSIYTESKDGSWKLIAGYGVSKTLSNNFKWISGSLQDLYPTINKDKIGKEYLRLNVDGKYTFINEAKLESVQIEILVNLDSLTGDFYVVHHFQDKNNFDFLKLSDSEIMLGRNENGIEKIFSTQEYSNKNWLNIKSTSKGKHFQGYINGELQVHGHATELLGGATGIFFSGSGNIKIRKIQVITIN